MSKLLVSIASMVMLFLGHQLYAGEEIRTYKFQGSTAQFIYATPQGWISQPTKTGEPRKFVSIDGKLECFVEFSLYKKTEDVTEDDLIDEIMFLSESVYGDDFPQNTDDYTVSDYSANDQRVFVTTEYVIDGREGQMLVYAYRESTGEEKGSVCFLIKNHEMDTNYSKEFDAFKVFSESITFLHWF